MIELSNDKIITGTTYSHINPNIYKEFRKSGDAEIFEKLVLDLMINKYSDDKELTDYVISLPKDKQRMAVLSLIDGDNILWSKMNSYVNESKNKFEHIKDVLKIMSKFVKDGEVERKKFGEVMTPLSLVREMLDTLPKEVWSDPNLKWLDPCNGAGTFPFVVIYKLMNGLSEWEPNIEKRYKHIIENMIYTCELQSRNVFLWLCGVDPKDEYTTNSYWGSFLDTEFDFHMKNVWCVEKFDIVIGNPPYQEEVGPNKTKSLWNFFVKKSHEKLDNNGYMVMVHPSGWRSVDGIYKDVQNLLKNNLIFLSMNDEKEGQKIFNATTNFDYYCYHKNTVSMTKIKDQNKNIIEINLSDYEFIPNGEFALFNKLIAKENDDRVTILHSYSAYETRKSWISKNKTEEFKYPVIYTIVKDGTINIFWSSIKNVHFDIPKVIWSNGMASPPTLDIDGKYGLTQFSYAIIDDINNLEDIKKCMNSEKFTTLMKLCYMGNGNRFDRKVLSTFRKDFWKEFI
jgi:hypothetical protein